MSGAVRRDERSRWPSPGDAGGTLPARGGSRVSRGPTGGGAEGASGLSNGLGWFSLGLGLVGLAVPSELANWIGVPNTDENRNLLRMVGLRELATGVGILSQPQTAGWVWGRVAGDAMDLAMLGKALSSGDADRGRLTVATAAVAGVAALDLYCGQQLSRADGKGDPVTSPGAVPRVKVITVNCRPEQAYSFWRNLENLPRFMRHLESIRVLDDRHSHWRVEGPAGSTLEWDAEIVEDRPNELIAWRSTGDADVDNWGQVTFRSAPGDRGTEVRVEMQYAPPGGKLGAVVARLFGHEGGQELQDDLRGFKQVLETGEVARSSAVPEGESGSLFQAPAQTRRAA